MSARWQCELMLIKKLLKELEASVNDRDWLNVHRVVALLSFKLKFETMYEESYIKEMNCNEKALFD